MQYFVNRARWRYSFAKRRSRGPPSSAPMFHPLRAVPSDDKILYALASLVSLRPRDRESLGV